MWGGQKVDTISLVERQVEIKVRDNGPYKVSGPFRLIDADGNEFVIDDHDRPVALCRCGNSQTKPFCDKSHKAAGFYSCPRAGGLSARD
jgi:CDGSH-type Zn-finger protein